MGKESEKEEIMGKESEKERKSIRRKYCSKSRDCICREERTKLPRPLAEAAPARDTGRGRFSERRSLCRERESDSVNPIRAEDKTCLAVTDSCFLRISPFLITLA